jgi:Lsr2 protein
MAIRILRIDDIDGTDGAELIPFRLDGVDYEIDLAPRNRARLLRAIQPFAERARLLEAPEKPSDVVALPVSSPQADGSDEFLDDGPRRSAGPDIAEMARELHG